MSGTEDLGNIKGERGDTYVPSVEQDENIVRITWSKNSTETDIEAIELKLPYYVPVKDANGNLKFNQTTNKPSEYSTVEFSADDLRGEKGDAGSISIMYVNALPTSDIDENAIYIVGSDVYVYNQNGDENNKWVTIESPIKFDNYCLKTEFNTAIDTINARIQNILEEQYNISQLLGTINTITDDSE